MSSEPTSLRVLIVDDEFLIRWWISETLEASGHVALQAENGAEALRVLNDPSAVVDAVVLDYRLPDSNDLTLLARIRQLAPRRPVILMTAFGAPEVTQGARDLGVYDVMGKPFEVDELHAKLIAACAAA
jgi:two-component system response regulator AtoC